MYHPSEAGIVNIIFFPVLQMWPVRQRELMKIAQGHRACKEAGGKRGFKVRQFDSDPAHQAVMLSCVLGMLVKVPLSGYKRSSEFAILLRMKSIYLKTIIFFRPPALSQNSNCVQSFTRSSFIRWSLPLDFPRLGRRSVLSF